MIIEECRYCDSSANIKNFYGDLVCAICGAEWHNAKIERELTDRELEEMENFGSSMLHEFD